MDEDDSLLLGSGAAASAIAAAAAAPVQPSERDTAADVVKLDFGGGGDDDDDENSGGPTLVGQPLRATSGSGSGEADAENGAEDVDARADGGADVFMRDGRPMTKSEAKACLDKRLYKLWKRRFGGDAKNEERHERKEKKKEKREKKEKKSKKEKKEKRKSKRSGGNRDGGDSDDAISDNDSDTLAAKRPKREEAKRTKRARNGARSAAGRQNGIGAEAAAAGGASSTQAALAAAAASAKSAKAKAKTLTFEQRKQIAGAAIELMRRARERDRIARSNGEPPLHRLQIAQKVETVLRRESLHDLLVAGGVLDELAHWLFDPTVEPPELAPLDLRTTALNVLPLFELEGIDNLGRAAKREERRKGSAGDDVDLYEGIDADTLRRSIIGRAVNFVRTHPQELNSNRNKAIVLLQNLSRALSGAQVSKPRAIVWRSIKQAGVAPPFDPVPTASEAFANSVVQIDPQDPTSYMRVPPKRIPKSYITTLFLKPEQLVSQVTAKRGTQKVGGAGSDSD